LPKLNLPPVCRSLAKDSVPVINEKKIAVRVNRDLAFIMTWSVIATDCVVIWFFGHCLWVIIVMRYA